MLKRKSMGDHLIKSAIKGATRWYYRVCILFIISFLVLILVFSFGCAASKSFREGFERGLEGEEQTIKEKTEVLPAEEEKTLITPSKTIDVRYIVIGLNSIILEHTPPNEDKFTTTHHVSPEVSVTYSNSQGGTEQISVVKLKKDVLSLGLSETANPDMWNGEIIAHYKSVPKGTFLYISAQNQSPGNIIVVILVNGIVWKNSVAKGMYSIATASGYYEE